MKKFLVKVVQFTNHSNVLATKEVLAQSWNEALDVCESWLDYIDNEYIPNTFGKVIVTDQLIEEIV